MGLRSTPLSTLVTNYSLELRNVDASASARLLAKELQRYLSLTLAKRHTLRIDALDGPAIQYIPFLRADILPSVVSLEQRNRALSLDNA
jgi:hypothetical protein